MVNLKGNKLLIRIFESQKSDVQSQFIRILTFHCLKSDSLHMIPDLAARNWPHPPFFFPMAWNLKIIYGHFLFAIHTFSHIWSVWLSSMSFHFSCDTYSHSLSSNKTYWVLRQSLTYSPTSYLFIPWCIP